MRVDDTTYLRSSAVAEEYDFCVVRTPGDFRIGFREGSGIGRRSEDDINLRDTNLLGSIVANSDSKSLGIDGIDAVGGWLKGQ